MRAVVFNNIENFCEFEKDYIRKGKLTHGDQMVHLNSLNWGQMTALSYIIN